MAISKVARWRLSFGKDVGFGSMCALVSEAVHGTMTCLGITMMVGTTVNY